MFSGLRKLLAFRVETRGGETAAAARAAGTPARGTAARPFFRPAGAVGLRLKQGISPLLSRSTASITRFLSMRCDEIDRSLDRCRTPRRSVQSNLLATSSSWRQPSPRTATLRSPCQESQQARRPNNWALPRIPAQSPNCIGECSGLHWGMSRHPIELEVLLNTGRRFRSSCWLASSRFAWSYGRSRWNSYRSGRPAESSRNRNQPVSPAVLG